MSLSVTRNIAYNALMTTQLQINVASANVANADTDGYTRKTASQEAVVYGGVNAGTTVTSIAGSVDRFLLKSLVAATSKVGYAETTDTYADRLQALFGSVSGSEESGSSIANSIASLETALLELAQTPESETLQSQALSSLDAVATQLRETSAAIQDLRADTDAAVGDAVADVNELLHTIDALNDQIAQARNTGQPTSDLEDKQRTALVTLSKQIDVAYFSNSSGKLQVYTTSGQILLDSQVHELSYQPATTVTAATTSFEAITVDGKDITAQLKSGTLGALVEQRDTILPDAQAELDALANALAVTLNVIHNLGTSLPPPSQLTGTAEISAADPFSGSGTARFAVVDVDGNLISYQDLDLSSYATVADLVTAIDGIDGLTASIDSNGHVAIAADNSGQGIAVNEMTGLVGSTQAGLSAWLGLNDLVTATGASDFRVSSQIVADPSRLATSQLSASAALTVGDRVVSVGSTTIANQLADAFQQSTSFAAAGSLGASDKTFADYAADIISGAATAANQATSANELAASGQSAIETAISSQSGVNLDEETARLSELENMYASAAQILSIVNAIFESLLEAVQSA